jgi:transcriptional regulator with XRE-family HTH domain
MDSRELDWMLKNHMGYISERVKIGRSKKGWDVLELVIRSRVNQVTIYNIENGTAENVTLKSLIGISRALEIDLPTLLSPIP